jgi:hypothetical protein
VREVAVSELKDGLKTLGLEGIEAIVFRTVGDKPSLFESVLPGAAVAGAGGARPSRRFAG